MRIQLNEFQKFGLVFVSYIVIFSFLFYGFSFFRMPVFLYYIFWVVIFISLFFPRLLKPVKFFWDRVLNGLRWVNMRILLGIIFFFVFSPVAFVRRLLKKDSLSLKYDAASHSYRVVNRNQANDIRRPY